MSRDPHGSVLHLPHNNKLGLEYDAPILRGYLSWGAIMTPSRADPCS